MVQGSFAPSGFLELGSGFAAESPLRGENLELGTWNLKPNNSLKTMENVSKKKFGWMDFVIRVCEMVIAILTSVGISSCAGM